MENILRKLFLLCLFTGLATIGANAQIKRQFNGQFNIIVINSLGNNIYEITGDFSDLGNTFTADQALPGDQIIDAAGNAFKVESIGTVMGSQIKTTAVDLAGGKFPTGGVGVLFRPTDNGYPLVTTNTPAAVLSNVLNTTTLSINSDLPKFQSGPVLPSSTAKEGDVIIYSKDNELYQLANSGWNRIDKYAIPYDFSSSPSNIPQQGAGSLVFYYFDQNFYISDGSSWKQLSALAEFPALPKFGDVFYDTSQRKLFMLSDEGQWLSISGASTPGGGPSDLPSSPKPGQLFFNTDENKLYVYEVNGNWVEVSINGSTPAGIINPDISSLLVKEGNMFYNTSEHRLYVFNGSIWLPVGNSLANGQIFVGNSSNVATAVSLSGDATITSSGKLAIKDRAITEEKLDKANIPLSGFGIPLDHISLGDGTTNYKLTNVGNPSALQDAATKSYVDALLANPSITLGLATGRFFVGNAANKAAAVAKNTIPLSGFGFPIANVSLGDGITNYKITNLADPTAAQDAATRNYVDTRVITPGNLTLPLGNIFVGNTIGTASAVTKNTITLNEFGTTTADISFGNFKLTNLGEPVSAKDAATKNYVDSKIIDPAYISLAPDNLFIGNASGKASAVTKNSIPFSNFGPATTDVSLGGFKLANVAEPILESDAASKKYVDGLFQNPAIQLSLPAGNFFIGSASGKAVPTLKSAIPVSGFGKATDNIYMGDATTQYSINFLADPLYPQDAATKNYVDSKIASPGSLSLTSGSILIGNSSNQAEEIAKSSIPITDFGVATSDLSLGNFKLTNVADPTTDQEAATKKYVDGKTGSVPSGPNPPTSPTTGSTYYNTTDKTFYVYDGTQWVPVSSGSTLAEGQFLVGDASNKATATAKNAIPLSGFGAPTADVSVGGKRILDLPNPILKSDAVNKEYVDVLVSTVGGNYMDRATYDANSNNKVDDAEKVNGLTVETAVPLNAVFTDEKVKVGAAGTPKTLSSYDFDDTSAYITIKNVSFSKMEPIAGNSIIGNNTGSPAVAKALTAAEVKSMLALDKVDNTADATKSVLSATKLTTPININGTPFDGSADIILPGDNFGNHEATKNIKTGSYSISNSGVNGQGLSFDTPGNATFSQDVTINGNMYTPSDLRLKTRVETLTGVLQDIDQIRGVSFEYIDQKKYAKGPKIGVIAQELQKIYPGMVTKGTDGFFKVDYTQLTAVLIQAVKEQQVFMQQQQKEILELKLRLEKQQQQIDVILKKIQ